MPPKLEALIARYCSDFSAGLGKVLVETSKKQKAEEDMTQPNNTIGLSCRKPRSPHEKDICHYVFDPVHSIFTYEVLDKLKIRKFVCLTYES